MGCPPFPFRHLSNLGPPPVKKKPGSTLPYLTLPCIASNKNKQPAQGSFIPIDFLFLASSLGTTSLFSFFSILQHLCHFSTHNVNPYSSLHCSTFYDTLTSNVKQETLPSARVDLLNPASSTEQSNPVFLLPSRNLSHFVFYDNIARALRHTKQSSRLRSRLATTPRRNSSRLGQRNPFLVALHIRSNYCSQRRPIAHYLLPELAQGLTTFSLTGDCRA